MQRAILRLTAVLVSAFGLWAGAATVSGRVVLDANGDGVAGADEAGVSGVLVSDGLTVCATDAAGKYTLDTPTVPVLLRTSTPRDHQPVGAFWRWADGTKAEDFLLVGQPQPDGFFFVQITDSHVGRADLVKQLVERFNRFPVPLAFVVHTGDMVGGADTVPVDKAMGQYQNYLDSLSGLQLPLFGVPGNHEHVAFNTKDAAKEDPRYGKGLYRQLLGPMHYSWNWGPYHFLALDGTRLPYQEKLGDEQLAWLKADLALTPVETPLVLFCHQSLPSLRDAGALQGLLAGRKVVAAFCGHLHETFVRSFAGFQVYQTGALSGSWWSGANPDGTPQGFALVKLANGTADYAYTAREGEDSLYISSPNASEIRSGTLPVEVTVLDLGRPVQVTATVGDQTTALSCETKREFSSVWKGEVDTTVVPDGIMALTATATRDGHPTAATARYLVLNGKEEPYQADADAVLKMKVRGIDGDDEVWLGDRQLGTIPKGTANDTELQFPIPAAQLKRVNKITIRAGGDPKNKDDFSVGPIFLSYKGKNIHDLRYVSFARHTIGDNEPTRYSAERDLYYCLP